MARFESAVLLNALPEAVFDFHQNPQNIRKISPWFLQIVEVRGEPVASVDAAFSLNLRVFFLPLNWSGVWAEVQNPKLLVDTAAGFPLLSWRHEHRFERIGDKTRMIDKVDYVFAGGVAGRIFGATIFRLQLALMFAGRHRATAGYFSAR